jgi:hypothetical protein
LSESGAKLKKLEVYGSIEGQISQIQNQGLKWKRRPNSGPAIEYDRDAIELIFKKSKLQLRTWLNKSQIEDRFWNWQSLDAIFF